MAFDGEEIREAIVFILTELRKNSGLTVREVTARAGRGSHHWYMQYESGERIPSLVQLRVLIKAINPKATITIAIKDAA